MSQKGSHVKLKRISENVTQALTILRHKELDKGTLRAIYRQASRYIPEEKLRRYFYTD
ncbi:MAG: type II toxin-antitoxin system HicA family toxin [Candidatus Pacearchaeota archaeon]